MKLRKKPEDTGRHRIKLRKKPEETGKTRLRILLKFPIFKVKSREKPRKIPENPGKSREIPVKTGKMGKNDKNGIPSLHGAFYSLWVQGKEVLVCDLSRKTGWPKKH